MPTELVTLLDQVKGSRHHWSAAIVAGPGPGPCESDFGRAVEATRMKEFVTRSNSSGVNNSVFTSICEASISNSLNSALEVFQTACNGFRP
jgi:hypothetical protein